jgi:hypothetical protein
VADAMIEADDAPTDADDIYLYAWERLAALEREHRTDLSTRVARAAEGIFLYAHLVLKDLLAQLPEVFTQQTIALPNGLSGFYREFLNRELGADETRWYETFRLILGLIAVARDEGLTLTQLQQTTKQYNKIEPALRVCAQYLDGALPEGPFRPFHRSFADFLLEDKNNADYHIDAGSMHLQITDYYWAIRNGAIPWRKWDDYGLRHTATHLAQAARAHSPQVNRHEQVDRLVTLVSDGAFRMLHKERVKDLAALQRDLEQALTGAAADDDPHAIPLVVESALALVDFRREELRPEPLFELARRGEVEAAARRLDLFDVDPEWRQATLLTIAWLASASQRDASISLRDRIWKSLPASDPLPLLLARLNATLEGTPLATLGLPPAPSAELVQELVARMSGEGTFSELLATRGLSQSGYLAEHDGPLLVAFAAANPGEGNEVFRQYLATHTSYNYVQYRNRSLWFLLDAVLRHPDQQWVRAMVTEMAAAALAGSTLEFLEGLPLTILALRAAAQMPGALQELETRKEQALIDADRLQQTRRQSDTWGRHKRVLAALASAYARLLGRETDAAALLNKALSLPYGFAGFQAPALLTLAEALRICMPNHGALPNVLKAALAASHNIQDATFCARVTACVNAMIGRWWGASGFEVEAMSRSLSQDASTPEFAGLHWVGEEYAERAPAGGMPLPDDLRQANTLRALADVYHRPLAEFQRLNHECGWTVDEPLPPGTPVHVPDTGFAALLAARFSAEALVDTALPDHQRVALTQSLVPIAAANPTALDTVLSRLLLAARPTDPAVLEVLDQRAKHNYPQC